MPTELTVATIGAGAVILAALISFIVAVSSAVIAKEQKVSEFRQAWINDLRNDIASTITLANDCIHYLNNLCIEKDNEIKFKIQEDYNKTMSNLELKSILLKLKLNPKKDNEIIESVNSIINSINKAATDVEESGTATHESTIKKVKYKSYKTLLKFEKNGHLTLKNEWERVKNGEKHFVKFRGFGELCLFAFITAFFVALAFVKIPELSRLLS